MILPSIEDENRYTAPPEPYEDDLHDCEPEDDIDWLEKNFGNAAQSRDDGKRLTP